MMELLEVRGQDLAEGQEANRGYPYLLEVIDRVLDKGLVIESWGSMRVLGIEVLTLDSNTVVASFAKYLDYGEAMEETADRSDTGDGQPEVVPHYPPASLPFMRDDL